MNNCRGPTTSPDVIGNCADHRRIPGGSIIVRIEVENYIVPDGQGARYTTCRRVAKNKAGEEVRCNGTGWLALDHDAQGKIYSLCFRCDGTGKDPGGPNIWDWAGAGFYLRTPEGLPVLINGHRVSAPTDPDGRLYPQLDCPSDGRPMNSPSGESDHTQRARARGMAKLAVHDVLRDMQQRKPVVAEPVVAPAPAVTPTVDDSLRGDLLAFTEAVHQLATLPPEALSPELREEMIQRMLAAGSKLHLKATGGNK